MQRESDKHGSRLDDQMSHEAGESHTREERVIEDDERTDPDRRAELARHITSAAWPAARDDLVETARLDQAPQEIIDSLRRLPREERFENVQEVWAAMGGATEGTHTHG